MLSRALLLAAELVANPKPVTPTLVRGWEVVLAKAGIRPEQVEPTFERLLSESTFFPSPADFLKLANPAENREAAEELAWQRVLDCVREIGPHASLHVSDLNGDGTALWALDRMGWERLCSELDYDNRSIMRADFVRLYRAGKSTDATVEYVPGSHEKHNAMNGRELSPMLVGRPEWTALPGGTSVPALASPRCPECGTTSRHLLSCSALDYLDERKALPAPEGFGKAEVAA